MMTPYGRYPTRGVLRNAGIGLMSLYRSTPISVSATITSNIDPTMLTVTRDIEQEVEAMPNQGKGDIQPCPDCNRQFKGKRGLASHRRQVHKGALPLTAASLVLAISDGNNGRDEIAELREKVKELELQNEKTQLELQTRPQMNQRNTFIEAIEYKKRAESAESNLKMMENKLADALYENAKLEERVRRRGAQCEDIRKMMRKLEENLEYSEKKAKELKERERRLQRETVYLSEQLRKNNAKLANTQFNEGMNQQLAEENINLKTSKAALERYVIELNEGITTMVNQMDSGTFVETNQPVGVRETPRYDEKDEPISSDPRS